VNRLPLVPASPHRRHGNIAYLILEIAHALSWRILARTPVVLRKFLLPPKLSAQRHAEFAFADLSCATPLPENRDTPSAEGCRTPDDQRARLGASSWAGLNPGAMTTRAPNVALLFETTNAYARSLLLGIGDYALGHGPWRLHCAEPGRDEEPPGWVTRWKGDGIIVRGDNKAMARAAASSAGRSSISPHRDSCLAPRG
jgi:hypothetical protein